MSEEIKITKSTKLKVFSKEDFDRIILKEDGKTFFEKKAEIEYNLGIEIPDSLTTLEEVSNHAYSIYQKTMDSFELTKLKIVRFKSNKKNNNVSKKDWIIDWIEENKNSEGVVLYSEVVKATDEFFGYSLQGKSPRTRVKNVVNELVDRNLVKLINGEIHVGNHSTN